MNIITVKINGVEYNLKGEEQEDYLHKVARYVDKKVEEILENNPKLSTSSASILTAINAADEKFKTEEQFSDMKKQFNNFKVQFEKLESLKNQEIEKLQSLLEEQNKENERLRNKLIELKHQDPSDKKEEEEINKMKVEMDLMQDTAKKYMEATNKYKSQSKELKFQIQSAKYKIMDLEKKLLDSQVSLAKEKKQNNPLKVKG
ncbi:cell division protein ZapA [Clostridium niameyense]|uniref:Cell division protein ZapA n=1 Tax=Clostridium niameyense TaxID=1622073 RepID=A0A6M0RBZ9_9CLOT|nr:cell division protein ZapA [Clostridium niameyense]NEZ47733.1 cell division protein ZapA [Clostridium niameyense]